MHQIRKDAPASEPLSVRDWLVVMSQQLRFALLTKEIEKLTLEGCTQDARGQDEPRASAMS